MEKRDHYQVLGVDRDATEDEIKKAFRRLAKQYHPDANKEQGAEARFIEINEAYEVLSDAQKRDAYDHPGPTDTNGASLSGSPSSLFPVFELFSLFPSGRTPQRGPDSYVSTTLTFEEATLGCQKELNFSRWGDCPVCNGNGARPGTDVLRCEACRGQGEVRQVYQMPLGSFASSSVCSSCAGSGRVVPSRCTFCSGRGTTYIVCRETIVIPAGVWDGLSVRIPGAGNKGSYGGQQGDLCVLLSVRSHPFFSRRGNDLWYQARISASTAERGGTCEIPMINGTRENLVIPAGTKNGQVLRLSGMGIPVVHSTTRGNYLITVRIE